MYPQLHSIGVKDPSSIEHFSLRQEAHSDVLKIYFHRQKGELFAKSVKFKFPRQHKSIRVNQQDQPYKQVTEINRTLTKVIDELNSVTTQVQQEVDIKKKVLADLHHLEKVVTAKIREIEQELEKLP
ncbi:DUF3461 family protein [Thaumasiovibrio sp. DFM-14]|uniref:DUF3461 family protein n=1 Tax=Thaumasiovibrio sp. DFM-14 TaxID=3384792 RepID=UPI00399F19A9